MAAPLLSQSFFTTLFEGLTPDQKFVAILVFFGCLCGMVIAVAVSVAKAWEAVRRREAEIELTRDLLDQGKDAEEIERILGNSSGGSGCTRSTAAWTAAGMRRSASGGSKH